MILEVLKNPAIAALVAGIPSIALAVIGYRQAMIVDRRAAITDSATGFDRLVDSLQSDNQVLRRATMHLHDKRIADVLERMATAMELLKRRNGK